METAFVKWSSKNSVIRSAIYHVGLPFSISLPLFVFNRPFMDPETKQERAPISTLCLRTPNHANQMAKNKTRRIAPPWRTQESPQIARPRRVPRNRTPRLGISVHIMMDNNPLTREPASKHRRHAIRNRQRQNAPLKHPIDDDLVRGGEQPRRQIVGAPRSFCE